MGRDRVSHKYGIKMHTNMKIEEKKHFRDLLIAKRQRVDAKTRELAGLAARNLLEKSVLFSTSQHVAGYFAMNDEFDCEPIIQLIHERGKTCYVPVLGENRILSFMQYRAGDALRPNRYGIPEPSGQKMLSAENLDLVLVPLVGFDGQGGRLGMGGGYYDRTFEFLRHSKELKKTKKNCPLIGVGYEIQGVDKLPADPWDVPLDGILTEKRLLVF